jgi:beta-lactamase superfamily II metal-dependent hydrolase
VAKEPKSVEIRGYQVGFGDCFLVSFIYSDTEKKHLLIDFGTTGLPRSRKPSTHMPVIARSIEKACGGELTAVIATHRHADHISGFATDNKTGKSGDIIRGLNPKVVLQPWTEDPQAAKNAKKATKDSNRSAKSFVTSLTSMHQVAQSVVELTKTKPAWMGASLHRELQFLGMDNIANESAVKNLIAMGEAKGATAVWAHHGSKSGLERHLPGVKIHVLGPPNLEQTEKIKKMRAKDPDQFWHLLAGFNGRSSLQSVRGGKRGKKNGTLPPDARWFRSRLDRMRGQQLLEIVRSLDDQMNNTSLILLFEVFGKKLLFPGDAQIENWSWALQDSPDHKDTLKLLSEVDVYKVGHHGSLNATPKKLLWENFKKRSAKANRLTSLLSTMPGKHGSTTKGTEVPRKPLLAALEKETELSNTSKLPKTEDCYTVLIEP